MKSPSPADTLVVERHHAQPSPQELLAQLMQVSSMTGKKPIAIARDYARLAIGPGKISPSDFMRLRLFDEKFWSGADLREVVGQRKNRDICFRANFRHDSLGINKVLATSYLAAHALPTIPLKALYAPQGNYPAPNVLRDRATVKKFLLRPDSYPLFGKPLQGFNSLGSVALVACLPAKKQARTTAGGTIFLEQLASDIERYYGSGYLFQPLLAPDKTIARLCNERLATVRFLTIRGEDGPRIFRAAWKIPAGDNVADNYWRSGNILAQVEQDSGRILRAVSGAGLDMQEHAAHPQTKIALAGFVHPHWREMQALAIEAARVLHELPLAGWDIAYTSEGPVIVEVNEHPDGFITQFGARRGLLDEEFKRFLAFQGRARREYKNELGRRFASL